MSNIPQKPLLPVTEKIVAQPQLQSDESPDDRYPGTFFRIPGVPMPGKTTWSLAK
ncbi:hypothetical protein [Methylomonas sp. AM2-LC]|uniref:hypothetical protein n=1 Tax=Methylomonas sp. AM2-LC TaxID=3153301 RepID=UPI00326567BB